MEGSTRDRFKSLPDGDVLPPYFLTPQSAPGGIHLKKVVFLGYTDMAAAGSRALFGLSMGKEYETVKIHGLESVEIVCRRAEPEGATERKLEAIQILHCKYEEMSPAQNVWCDPLVSPQCIPIQSCQLTISYISHISIMRVHFAGFQLFDPCLCLPSRSRQDSKSLCRKKILQLDEFDDEVKPIYENAYNTDPVTKHLPFPKDTKIMDPFLSSLIQMIQFEDMSCHIFTCPGHKAVPGPANDYDGSFQAITHFHAVLKKWSRLHFDEEFSQSLTYRDPGSDSDLMYV